MGDPPRSPTTDFYGIAIKGMCKVYTSFFTKWHQDKSPSNEAKTKAINEAFDKALDGSKHEEKFTNDEPSMPESFHRRSEDDSFFSRSASFLSRNGSRRSHTPSPRPTYLSKSASKKSTTPKISSPISLLRSFSRKSTSETELPTSSSGRSTPETDKIPTLSRNTSQRSTTPIIFSRSESTARRKPPPIEKKLECTLEELCEGCIKKIKITKDVIMEPGIIVKEIEVLKIKLKPGWKKGTKITFEGKGDERPGYLPADIIFLIEEQKHPLFKRSGNDLEIAVEIPLVQALTGCSLSVPLLLGGETMNITIQDVICPGYEKIIRGQGMPNPTDDGTRGDLRVIFLVSFPTELSDEKRSKACRILQDCF